MKKLIALFLALAMILAMTACGGTSAPEDSSTLPPAAAPSEASTEAPTEAPTEVSDADPQMGTYENGTYTNEFLGISCAMDNSWTLATAEEMAQIQGMSAELVTDEDLARQLESSGSSMVFYAAADEGLVTMNIMVENLGILYGLALDEESYLELSGDSLPTALESMGFENVTQEMTTVQYLGSEHVALRVHGSFSGVEFYELLIPRKVGTYMSILTIASYVNDITADLAGMFSTLEG